MLVSKVTVFEIVDGQREDISSVEDGTFIAQRSLTENKAMILARLLLELKDTVNLLTTGADNEKVAIIRGTSYGDTELYIEVQDARGVFIARAREDASWFDTKVDMTTLAKAMNALAEGMQFPFRVSTW